MEKNLPFQTLQEFIKFMTSIRSAVYREVREFLHKDMGHDHLSTTSLVREFKWVDVSNYRYYRKALFHNNIKICQAYLYHTRTGWDITFEVYYRYQYQKLNDRLLKLKEEEIYG